MYKIFSTFIIVGAIGFIIDFSLYLLFIKLDLGVYLSRALAFIFAVQSTYFLNKKFTFSERNAHQLSYFIGQGIGIIINYCSFIFFYRYITPEHSNIAFFAGSAIALFYNFAIANLWAFKK